MPGLLQTTGLGQPAQFSPAGQPAPDQGSLVKRVSWHSSLGKFKGYGSAPPTRVGFSDPATDCCNLFEQMQSEYAAHCEAKRLARWVASYKPGKSQNLSPSMKYGADSRRSSPVHYHFRKSLGLAKNDTLDFPDLRSALKRRAPIAPCVALKGRRWIFDTGSGHHLVPRGAIKQANGMKCVTPLDYKLVLDTAGGEVTPRWCGRDRGSSS